MSFNVWNPAAGRWFILHWWTDHDRGHLAFAETTDGLRLAARSVFEKEPGAECKGMYEIEMVAPSERMERLAEMHDRRDEVNQFYYEIAARVTEAMDAGNEVPAPFERCRKFEVADEDPEAAYDEWASERHYSCKNCDSRLKLVGITRDELYDRYAVRWRILNPPHRYRPSRNLPIRTQSKAERAMDGEKLWFAHANFGDHAKGIELREVDLSDVESFRPTCLSDQTLFFYRLVGKLPESVAKEIGQMIHETKATDKKRRKTTEARRKTDRAAEERARIQATLGFFKEEST